MSSLPFLPRSLQKRKTIHDNEPRSSHSISLQNERERSSSGTAHQEPRTYTSDEDLLVLLELGMSDYNISSNIDLEKAINFDSEGFISLKQLIRRFPPLSELSPQPSETDMVRCIQNSSDPILETRMTIREPSRRNSSASSWFEVRRKDWKDIIQFVQQQKWTEEWWNIRTVYVERIPPTYRSIASIARYFSEITTPRSLPTRKAVQAIQFPPRHLAPPMESPRFKGFAFLVLDAQALVEQLCRLYPWDKPSPDPNQDVQIFGTRILDKPSWDKLKDEYLVFQQRLVSRPHKNPTGDVQIPYPSASGESKRNVALDTEPSRRTNVTDEMPLQDQEPPSWFPRNCLVFVRNIHPETNKTTIRALLGSRLPSSKDGVDYVDLIKGVDSCHVRVTSPSEASALVSFFSENAIAQRDALDQEGGEPTTLRLPITIELIHGKREELYWEKVPEKTRQAALERLYGSAAVAHENDDGRKGKRRKKG